MAPAEVPMRRLIVCPCSARAVSAPTKAEPLAPPPSNTTSKTAILHSFPGLREPDFPVSFVHAVLLAADGRSGASPEEPGSTVLLNALITELPPHPPTNATMHTHIVLREITCETGNTS